jgi:hypothetical protein
MTTDVFVTQAGSVIAPWLYGTIAASTNGALWDIYSLVRSLPLLRSWMERFTRAERKYSSKRSGTVILTD